MINVGQRVLKLQQLQLKILLVFMFQTYEIWQMSFTFVFVCEPEKNGWNNITQLLDDGGNFI